MSSRSKTDLNDSSYTIRAPLRKTLAKRLRKDATKIVLFSMDKELNNINDGEL